jgi:DNA-binding transcriptional LysR family regulator
MDTNRIRYFLSLARTGSVTKAAELHNISGAAFSKAMKVFEGEVGEALTIRHGRGLVLTDYAKIILPSLQAIIRQIDSVRDQTAFNATSRKVLKIATFEVFSTHFMAKAILDFFPKYKCEIHEMIPGKMEEAIASGLADFALTYIPIPHPDLDLLRIVDIEMGIFGHPSLIAKMKSDALVFATPVSPIEGSPNKVRGLDGWPDDAFPRSIQFHVEMLETAMGLCREGLAVAYIPKFSARLYNEIVRPELQLVSIALPKGFPKRRNSVFLIKRKSDCEGIEAKKLAQAVRKICR